MKQLDHQINLDRANGAEDNASKEEGTMRNSSTKTPWFLRFAPGAILRKSGLVAVLAVTTVLTPTIIEQAQAASASTNQVSRPLPNRNRAVAPTTPSTNRVTRPPARTTVPTYRPPLRRTTPSTNQVSRPLLNRNRAVAPTTPSTNRVARPPTRISPTNQVQTPSRRTIPSRRTTPAAVPVPVVVVAKPVLKKGAILAGKWLIAVLAEYGVHTALDRVFQNNKDQEAYVTVHGAQWLSNEYFWRSSNPNTPSPRNVLTTTATMKKENDTASAEGWDAINNRSMTQSEAKGHMKRRIASTTESTWSAIVPVSPTTQHAQTMFFPIKARTDHYAAEEARILALYRAMHPTIIFTKCGEDLKKWKVGSFEMESDFDDPAPILKALGTENAIDSDANYYEATAKWQYRELNPNGEWSEWNNRKKKFSQETADGIKSWEDHTFDFDFCKDNHEITDPAIYEGIRRFISKRPVYERKMRTGQMSRSGKFYWSRVGWEPVVAQEYQDLSGN